MLAHAGKPTGWRRTDGHKLGRLADLPTLKCNRMCDTCVLSCRVPALLLVRCVMLLRVSVALVLSVALMLLFMSCAGWLLLRGPVLSGRDMCQGHGETFRVQLGPKPQSVLAHDSHTPATPQ